MGCGHIPCSAGNQLRRTPTTCSPQIRAITCSQQALTPDSYRWFALRFALRASTGAPRPLLFCRFVRYPLTDSLSPTEARGETNHVSPPPDTQNQHRHEPVEKVQTNVASTLRRVGSLGCARHLSKVTGRSARSAQEVVILHKSNDQTLCFLGKRSKALLR